MKKTKIIVPALGLLLLSTAASVSGTVAWFSANATVNVSGMSVTTKVSGNLLIANDTLDSTAKKADSNFGSALVQNVSGVLEPVSTINGSSFFYTTNAKANGDAETDVYKAYNQSTFRTDYGVNTAVGYVDYVFQLKAINPENSSAEVRLTNLELTYTKADAEVDESTAYRVAVSVEDITSAAPSGNIKTTVDGIYAPSTAANQSDADSKNFAINATNAAPVQLAVTGNKYNNLSKLGDVPAQSTSYFKVIARLYLEGEDTTCTNDTFLELTGSWALNLSVSMDGSTANVNELALA